MSSVGARLQQMSAIKLALLARQLRSNDSEARALRAEPIAIVGMGCRFPGGVDDPQGFWRLLVAGTDAVREVPPDRWDWQRLFDANPAAPGKITTRWGGFIDAVDSFDAAFFGISPREALHLDPQQRLFLEVAYEAFEDAGLVRDQLAGGRCGVFAASYHNDYAQLIYGARQLIGAHTVTGASHSVLANRLSYLLDLRGPSVSVDTACSSSLVALHLACQSLRGGECDLALAGGVSLMITPELSIALSKWGFLAEDGRCKTFDARANGFVRGEGCGAVVLKRLGDALADGDTVLALIRGSSVNQDGRTNVLTAPSGLAQQSVVREALENGALQPDDISYIEAHGTGTALGDPIELEALAAVIGERSAARRVMLGSVKTNIGHLEAAAGIAGVIKVALAMQAQAIPPHLHYTAPNPHFDLAASPFRIPTTLEPWAVTDTPRRAGVSSFGFGGTNAHVVLEEAPRLPADETPDAPPPYLLALSAQSPAALRALAGRCAELLSQPNGPAAADVCFSATRCRDLLDHRLTVVGSSAPELADALLAAARGETSPAWSVGQLATGERADVAFVFSGQGPQWWAMGRELLAAEPIFADALRACDTAMRPHAPWSLLEELGAPEASSRLAQTEFAQPALFALQFALTAVWRDWGVMPAAVLGHSVGEIAAACAAGILDLPNAARLAVLRGRIMQAATGLGRMAALEVDAAEGERLVAASAGRLSLAAINAPRSVVLSGDAAALDGVLSTLTARGVGHRLLPVDYAFHSAQMEPFRAELESAMSSLQPRAATLPYFSTVTGARCDGRSLDAAYWGRNLRGTVRFTEALESAAGAGLRLFLEVAPHPVLARDIQATLERHTGVRVASSLRRGRPERASLLAGLGLLHSRGVAVQWGQVQPEGRRVPLPLYPWQRSRYWVSVPQPAETMPGDPGAHPLLGTRLDSPALSAKVFESTLSLHRPAFLGAHRVAGSAVVPATAFIEMALTAAQRVWGEQPTRIEGLVLHDALRLEDGARRVQFVWSKSGIDAFEIFSRPAETSAAEWTRHASGCLRALADALPASASFATLCESCPDTLDADTLYAQFAALGLDFGAPFRAITQAWFNDREAVALISAPDEFQAELARYRLHPALLDACLQPCTELLRRGAGGPGTGEVFLPVGIDSFDVLGRFDERPWTHVTLRPAEADAATRVADINVRDSHGAAIVVLRGLRLQRVRLAALASPGAGKLYHEAWADAAPGQSTAALAGTRWLIVADSGGMANVLASRLHACGAHSVVLEPAAIDAAALAPQLGANGVNGIVHLCSLDAHPLAALGTASLRDGAQRSAGTALALLQLLLRSSAPQTPLWLVTRGARPARAGDPVDPLQALPWGLARAAEIEHPELVCRRVDLDPAASAEDIDDLLAELANPVETEAAWRSHRRSVPRLVRSEPLAALSTPWRLEASRAGSLDGLARVPMARRDPGAGEVEIEVAAAGLNFRDVLSALGMYPGAAGPVGGECAGVVSRVGAGVTALAPGDDVMAFARGSFASHVVVRDSFVLRRPAGLSVAGAASTPIAFLTALYALQRLAGLKRGERILIHAAAGGVGLAAVQVAQRLGAEVYATAGSPAKREFLAALGVRHLMDSRSLDFAEQLRVATRGEGVHVVLNALAGDFIGASVAALASGGRFVEMGKRDIWSAKRMRDTRSDIAYFPFDLGDAADADTGLVPSLFTELSAQLADGSLQALPLVAWPIEQADEAFRSMAQARHIGKIVLNVSNPRVLELQASGTYLVTGGCGALGLQVARWLAERGARHLVLTGRHAPSAEAAGTLESLRSRGVQVRTAQVDVSDGGALAALLAQIEASGAALRGVVHAAGVLDDAVLLDQQWDQVQRVLDPKLVGAWHLHRLTRTLSLDFFVLFSAGAAVLGSPGQAGYCAANLALDALAEVRRSQGLPATSIAWGPWADGGMAAALSDRDAKRWRERGVSALATNEALALLERAIQGPGAAVAALTVDWNRFAAGAGSPRFGELASRPATPDAIASAAGGLLTRLAAALPTERRNTLAAFVRAQARLALGLAASTELDERQPLRDLGLDSLMAVELRNALVAAIAAPLPVTLLFDFPTVAGLCDHLASPAVLALDQSAAERHDTPAPPTPMALSMSRLSDAEAEALLLAELDAPNPQARP
ncbi:MAG: type I polyketide synthase [Burkholderiales bacterium]